MVSYIVTNGFLYGDFLITSLIIRTQNDILYVFRLFPVVSIFANQSPNFHCKESSGIVKTPSIVMSNCSLKKIKSEENDIKVIVFYRKKYFSFVISWGIN